MKLPEIPREAMFGTRLIRAQTCKACKWSAPAQSAGQYECREKPPSANSVPTPQGLVVHTCWPIVGEDWWCGHWQPKIDKAN